LICHLILIRFAIINYNYNNDNKRKIQKTIQNLPDNPEIELVIEKLILLDKIEQGIKDVNEGNVFSGEEVREKLGKWLKYQNTF